MPTQDVETVIQNFNVDGDHDKFAHYADKTDVTEAFVTGIPIIALCGKIWVPTRDGSGFPVCPECQKIFSRLTSADGRQV